MGFVQPSTSRYTGWRKVERAAIEAARRKFSPEFINRLDKLVVFHPLKRDELDEVLEIELGQVQKRVLDSTTRPFLFRVTSEGRQFLLEEGTDQSMERATSSAPSNVIWFARFPDCWPAHKCARATCFSSIAIRGIKDWHS